MQTLLWLFCISHAEFTYLLEYLWKVIQLLIQGFLNTFIGYRQGRRNLIYIPGDAKFAVIEKAVKSLKQNTHPNQFILEELFKLAKIHRDPVSKFLSHFGWAKHFKVYLVLQHLTILCCKLKTLTSMKVWHSVTNMPLVISLNLSQMSGKFVASKIEAWCCLINVKATRKRIFDPS